MRTDLPIVKDRLTALTGTLTPSEQVLADILLKDYPVAGLQSITRLAEAAGVSTP
ncbi:MAG: RpiR family transcriptional regulator, partial [Pseudomonadota bacterium]